MSIRVTSASNSRLKASRQLHSRSGVLKRGMFLMEGPRFILDHLVRRAPEWVLLSDDAGGLSRRAAERAGSTGADVLELPPELFQQISGTETSQGIAAVFPLPVTDPATVPPRGLFLLLDCISDPGNMGTILRSAAAFGCGAVITGQGSCFPYIPKVTRAAAGMNAIVPLLCDVSLPDFMAGNRSSMEFIGADASGESPDTIHRRGENLGIVIGSEAHGISPEVRKFLDFRVAIPMAGGVDSLNAAVSASILLYEAARDGVLHQGPGTRDD